MTRRNIKKSKDGSTTYSTRFEPDQCDLVDEACRVLNWTPARFIRDACIRRAVDVINASGPAQHQLSSLARLVVRQLRGTGGIIMSKCLSDSPTDEVVKHDLDEYSVWDNSYEGEGSGEAILTARGLDGEQTSLVRRAMRSCPSEFTRLLLDLWELGDTDDNSFQPKVNADQLILGGDTD